VWVEGGDVGWGKGGVGCMVGLADPLNSIPLE